MTVEDKVYCPFNPPTYDCPGGCPSMQDRACINGDENGMTPPITAYEINPWGEGAGAIRYRPDIARG